MTGARPRVMVVDDNLEMATTLAEGLLERGYDAVAVGSGRQAQERLAGGQSAFTSSPVAADGKVYFASEDGHVYVLKAAPTLEIVAENDMRESVLATPAISEGALVYRTQGHVIAVRNGAQTKPD